MLQEPNKTFALKILRQQWAFILRGELGFRIELWRSEHQVIKRRIIAAQLRRQPAARLKNLRGIIDTTVMRLKQQNLMNHCPELKLAIEHEEMRNTALMVGCKMLYRMMVKVLHDLICSLPLRWWRSKMRDEGIEGIRFV